MVIANEKSTYEPNFMRSAKAPDRMVPVMAAKLYCERTWIHRPPLTPLSSAKARLPEKWLPLLNASE